MFAAASSDLPLGAYLAGFAGLAGLPGLLIAFVLWRRRKRNADGERRPMETKLLRPAGYGLIQRLDESLQDGIGQVLGLAVVGGGLGMAAYVTVPILWGLLLNKVTLAQLLDHPRWYVFLSLALINVGGVGGVIYQFARCLQVFKIIEAVRLGLRGEQAVGEALADARIAVAGYRVFHDVPGDGKWNIDHVLVGPAGVFVLETKARSKRPGREGQAKHEVQFDGRMLRFPNWDDHETVRQVERNTEWVRKFLADFAPPELAYQPAVVVPGWYVTSLGNYPVKAMNTTYLPNYLASMKRRFESDELKAVIRRLDERCRTLEF